jgi:hypothetical protein
VDLDWVVAQTGAQSVVETELLQNLWSGYGQLLRLRLHGGEQASVILKRVNPPESHRESVSDTRKRRSYAVEQAWYKDLARSCDRHCRVAGQIASHQHGDGSLLLLEDLRCAGFYPLRPPGQAQVRAGLSWLAHFHARFLGTRPKELWEQGSYWHLDTRQQEWQAMESGCLKDIAESLDWRLKRSHYQSLVHGDAKPANFLWHENGEAAAVDFQYIGPGCGIRDVAYFLDCCLGESGCQSQAEGWLDFYFEVLTKALHQNGHGHQAARLEHEWRLLFPIAWCDYCRFWQGWGRPTPLGPYSQEMLRLALERL